LRITSHVVEADPMSDPLEATLATPGTAISHLTESFPRAAPHTTSRDVRRQLASASRFESATDIAIVDAAGRLTGLVRIEDLLSAADDTPMTTLMDPDPPVVSPDLIQEAAAWKAVEHGQGALAVVDDNGALVGLIPAWRMLGVLLAEHDADLARLGGYLHQGDLARSAMTESVSRRFWHRLPWLVIGLVGAMAAAGIVGGFEDRLTAEVTLAFFIPGIVYMADAVGTQTEAVIVRGLSVDEPIRSVVVREISTGLIMGAAMAAVAYPVALLWAAHPVALTVAVSIWAACTIATAVAMALPALLRALGQDPAFGSGPLATVIQDLLSIVIYFGFASALT
jgi:magnesium transporter